MAGSNYNAETAWNYLGAGSFGGRGAYDYSSQPKYRQFRDAIIQEPVRTRAQEEYDDTLGAAFQRFAKTRQDLSGASQNSLAAQVLEGALSGITANINAYPQIAFNQALAGRYSSFI
jgi:hypothetical protein